jgi:hypothetical protein
MVKVQRRRRRAFRPPVLSGPIALLLLVGAAQAGAVKSERLSLGAVAEGIPVPTVDGAAPLVRVPIFDDARTDPELGLYDEDGVLPVGFVYARRSPESLPAPGRVIRVDDLRQAPTRALASMLERAGVRVSGPSASPALTLQGRITALRIERFGGAREPWLRPGPLALELTLLDSGEAVWRSRLIGTAAAGPRTNGDASELLEGMFDDAMRRLSRDRSFFTALRYPALARAKLRIDGADYAGARELLAGLIAQDPRLGEAHYLDGVALGLLGRMDESAQAFARAARLGARGDAW